MMENDVIVTVDSPVYFVRYRRRKLTTTINSRRYGRYFPSLWFLFLGGYLLFLLSRITFVMARDRSNDDNGTSLVTGLLEDIKTDDFYRLLTNTVGDYRLFVDKSLLIESYLNANKTVVFVRQPRKFGKSLNADMLRRFLEIDNASENRKLFAGGTISSSTKNVTKRLDPLNISYRPEIMRHQGRYTVLYVSLKNVTGSSYREIASKFASLIASLCRDRDYLTTHDRADNEDKETFVRYAESRNMDKNALEKSLTFLTSLLKKYRNDTNGVHLVIDDYDVPLSYLLDDLFRKQKDEFKTIKETKALERALRSPDFSDTASLLRDVLGNWIRSEEGVLPIAERGISSKAMVVGTFPIWTTLFAGDDSRYEDTKLEFGRHYGFNVKEINELLQRAPFRTNGNHLVHWFGEYRYKLEGVANPWSIMRCLASRGKLGNYWMEVANDTPLVDGVFMADELQEIVQSLSKGERIDYRSNRTTFPPSVRDAYGLLSALYQAGYLRYCRITSSYRVYSPEVQNAFKVKILKWVRSRFDASVEDFAALGRHLAAFRVDEFEDDFADHLSVSPNWLCDREWFYDAIVLHLKYSMAKDYFEERPTDKGFRRPNTVLISKWRQKSDNAVVIKYKLVNSTSYGNRNRRAKEGLVKMDKLAYKAIRQYDYVKRILEICMAFCSDNSFVLNYKILNVDELSIYRKKSA